MISRILTDDFEKYARYADKVEVRKYVQEKGLGDHLLEHYHYWDDASKIKLEELPDKFVLKTSNGAGGKDIFICRDKQTFDLEDAKLQLAKALEKSKRFEPPTPIATIASYARYMVSLWIFLWEQNGNKASSFALEIWIGVYLIIPNRAFYLKQTPKSQNI